MEHTPGPFRERLATGTADRHILGKNEPVCVIPYSWGTPERRAANAALLISAPNLKAEVERLQSLNAELVEALEEIERDLVGPSDFCSDSHSRPNIQVALETARRAQAKARGE